MQTVVASRPLARLRRVAIAVAATVAMTAAGVAGAAPASAAATEGWFVHSGGYPGDIFGEMPCLDTGAQLYAADEIQGYYCGVNKQNFLWDLWVVQGTWVYHSRHADIWVCFDAGDAQKAAGNAYHFDCRATPGTNRTVDLYLIRT